MSTLSNLIKKAAPIVATFSPEPISRAAAQAITAAQAKQERDYQRKLQQQRDQNIRNKQMAQFNDMSAFGPSSNPNIRPEITTTANTGFGSSFGSFARDVGQNIISPLSGLFGGIAPFFSQQSSGQPAIATRGISGGQESQASGQQNAFVGGVPNLLGQAARFLRTPGGSAAIGGATGIIGSMFGGDGQKMRITRKMKSQYRAILNLNMGNIDLASQMLGVSSEMFVQVLLKRFRNDGAVVTKAALRKTKRTVNRLKGMCDMYDSLRPSATRRKSPMKRASTTLISNK